MENYFTPQQIAERLQVKKLTILRYIRSKRLRAVRLGKGYRISQADLDDFIKRNQTV